MPANSAKEISELHDPKTIVCQLFEAFSALDIAQAMEFIDEDCVYKNVPFHTAHGKSRIARDIGNLIKRIDSFEIEVINIAANDNVVLTERIDSLGGRFFKAALPLMGTFVIKNGKITEWRDYFDWSSTMGKVGRSLLTLPFKPLTKSGK